MNKILLSKLEFGSFVKLFVVTSVPLGIIFGIFSFIFAMLGGSVNANVGTIVLTGAAGGFASLILSPVIFLILGVLAGCIAFFPFNLSLLACRKIKLYGVFQAIEDRPKVHVNDFDNTDENKNSKNEV